MSESRLDQLAALLEPTFDKYSINHLSAREALEEIIDVFDSIGHVFVPKKPSARMMEEVHKYYRRGHDLEGIIEKAIGVGGVSKKVD